MCKAATHFAIPRADVHEPARDVTVSCRAQQRLRLRSRQNEHRPSAQPTLMKQKSMDLQIKIIMFRIYLNYLGYFTIYYIRSMYIET